MLLGCPGPQGLIRIGPQGYAYVVDDPHEYAVLDIAITGAQRVVTGYELHPRMGASLCGDLFKLCTGPFPGELKLLMGQAVIQDTCCCCCCCCRQLLVPNACPMQCFCSKVCDHVGMSAAWLGRLLTGSF